MKFGQNARAAGRTIKALGVALALLAAPQAAFAQDAATAASPAASAAAAPEAAASAAPAAASAAASAAAAPAAAPAVDPNDPRFKIAEGGYTPMVPTAGKGMPVDKGIHLQDQYSDNGLYARWMHDAILMPVIVAISLLVLFLLLWVIVRYNRAPTRSRRRPATTRCIEVIWTRSGADPGRHRGAFDDSDRQAVQAGPGQGADGQGHRQPVVLDLHLSRQRRVRSDLEHAEGFERREARRACPHRCGRSVEAGGRQSHGRSRGRADPHPDHRRRRDPLVRRAFAVVQARRRSGPDQRKGHVHQEPGVYFGQCSELCGVRHGYMPIAIEALPRDKYNAWVMTQSGGKIDGMPEAPPLRPRRCRCPPLRPPPAAAAPKPLRRLPPPEPSI
jgi:cytochrome c oxidase subunit 2